MKRVKSVYRNPNRAISPVIATVLLVAIVIVTAMIVFLWFRAMGTEVIMKFDKNIELTCGDIEFVADYSNGLLSISNTGNIPIFGMKISIEGSGSQKTYDLKKDLSSDWPDLGLNQGGAFSADISGTVGSAEKLVLTPVLMGSSKKGERIYICQNDRYKRELFT